MCMYVSHIHLSTFLSFSLCISAGLFFPNASQFTLFEKHNEADKEIDSIAELLHGCLHYFEISKLSFFLGGGKYH